MPATEDLDDPRATLAAVRGSTISGQVLRLSIPVLIEQALLYLVGLSDTILTGRYLSVAHLAAVTNAAYFSWFLGSVLMVVSAGATALVARRTGARDQDGARRICGQSITLALLVGTFAAVLGWFSADRIVFWLGLGGTAATEAALYLRFVLVVTPLIASRTVGIACLRGSGDTATGMWVMVLVNAINVMLSWSLVAGFVGLPKLGMVGIALGTAVSEAVGGLVVLGILFRGRSGLWLRRSLLRLVPSDVKRLLRISIPAAGESLTNAICQLWFLAMINRLGSVATAAHGIAIRCEALAFLTVMAFAIAGGTLAGQYLGARRPDLATRAARTAWGMGLAVSIVLGVLLYWQARPMFELFLGKGQPEVVALGVPVIRLVSFALPALATIQVLTGVLRGSGDTTWPWVIVLFGYLVVRMPLTWLAITPVEAGGFGWGLYGAWLAMFADLHVRGILIAGRFLQGGWRTVRM